jgi:AraC-like DNA-binding protein
MCAFRSRAGMNAASSTSSKPALAKIAIVENGVLSRASTSSNLALAKATIAKNGALSRASAHGTPRKAKALMPPVREERLQKILEMIASGKPCTIHALAQEFNLSPSHLQHLFKQQTGVCLGHLLTQQKLHRAAYLLTHSNLRIKEISSSAGYEHTSSFIRAFERHFAQPPRLYRKNGPARTKS